MNTPLLTKIIIGSGFLLAVVYNIVIKIESTARDTISKVILDSTTAYPSLSFTFGVMVGHWLWPMQGMGEEPYWKYSLPLLIPIVLGLAAYDFLRGLPPSLPIVYFLAGLFAGHYGWPQKELGT